MPVRTGRIKSGQYFQAVQILLKEVPEMIQMQTMLKSADNTGAKELM